MSARLRRVTVERRMDGCWEMVRELEATGDRWTCDDLLEAFEIVNAAFRPDGTLRSVLQTPVATPRQGGVKDGLTGTPALATDTSGTDTGGSK